MLPNVFHVNNVRRDLGGRSIPNEVGFDLRIRQGSCLAVLGRSGSGKTTLLNILGLLLESSSGRVTCSPVSNDTVDYGALYSTKNGQRVTAFRRAHFGFVFQEDNLMENLSVWQNMAIPLLVRGLDHTTAKRRVAAIASRLFDRDRLAADLLNASPSDLSGGERSRVALLRGLIHDPSVLFLDEPLNYLDNFQKARALSMLRSWQAGSFNESAKPRTIIMVTHDLRVAAGFAGDVVVIAPDQQVHVQCEEHLSTPTARFEWLCKVLPDH